MFFVIKRQVGDLASGGIDELTGQTVGKVAREEHHSGSLCPDFRLIDTDPISLGFSLQVADGACHAGDSKKHAPEAAHVGQAWSAALIGPVDGRTKGLTILIEVDEHVALRGDCHAGNLSLIHTGHSPKLLTSLTEAFPEQFRFHLCPARFRGRILR